MPKLQKGAQDWKNGKNTVVSNMIEELNGNKHKLKTMMGDYHPDQNLIALGKTCDLLGCAFCVIETHKNHQIEKYKPTKEKSKYNFFTEIKNLTADIGNREISKEKMLQLIELLKKKGTMIDEYQKDILELIRKYKSAIETSLKFINSEIKVIDDEIEQKQKWIQKLDEYLISSNNLNHKIGNDYKSKITEISNLQWFDYKKFKGNLVPKLDHGYTYFLNSTKQFNEIDSKSFLKAIESKKSCYLKSKNDDGGLNLEEIIYSSGNITTFPIIFQWENNSNLSAKFVGYDILHSESKSIDASITIKDILDQDI